jgi:hypothetical protein
MVNAKDVKQRLSKKKLPNGSSKSQHMQIDLSKILISWIDQKKPKQHKNTESAKVKAQRLTLHVILSH